VTWLADADLARTQTFGVAGIDRDNEVYVMVDYPVAQSVHQA
jgi:hypothetical protein